MNLPGVMNPSCITRGELILRRRQTPAFRTGSKAPLSINPEQILGACPERSRRIRPGTAEGLISISSRFIDSNHYTRRERKMKQSKVIVSLWLLAIFVFVGPSIGKAADVLHMYTALDPNEAKVYIEAFIKDTKINVEWVRMSAGEVLTRLKAESKNPQVSLWYGGPSAEFIAGKKEGLLIPELKANISIAYPYTSGTSFTTLATLVQLMGEDKAFDYWKKLDPNIHHYNTSGSACVTQAGLGEIAIGIAFSHDILAKGTSKGYPIKGTFPSEGTGFEIGAMALVKGGPELELGKKFIDWALSKQAQA